MTVPVHTLETAAGTIELPGHIPWVDEFQWSPVTQAISVTLGGSAIIEVGVQSVLRPITLAGSRNTGWVTGVVMDALAAAEIAQLDTPFTLTLSDGRSFSVLFAGGGTAPAVTGEIIGVYSAAGALVANVTPQNSTERSNARYWVTVRMIVVG